MVPFQISKRGTYYACCPRRHEVSGRTPLVLHADADLLVIGCVVRRMPIVETSQKQSGSCPP